MIVALLVVAIAVLATLLNIAALIRHQTGMIRAASDLNLEAQQRMLGETARLADLVEQSTRYIRTGAPNY